MPRENNYAFIDAQNLNLGVQNMGWSVDYAKFHRYLKDKYRVTQTFFFIGYVSRNQRLYTKLQRIGYTLVFKDVVEHWGKTKGNVDAELVLQVMHELCENNFDNAVIVSGDGDFACLASYLVKRNRLKAIIAPRRKSTSKLLINNYGRWITFLNDKQKQLRRQKVRP